MFWICEFVPEVSPEAALLIFFAIGSIEHLIGMPLASTKLPHKEIHENFEAHAGQALGRESYSQLETFNN